MSLGLDDKLLGEKVHYYCSSSEEEDNDSDEENGSDQENEEGKPSARSAAGYPETESFGPATNTGPKGVIKDWREYKRLETEKREEQERERLQLAKKLTLTCRSHLNDEQEKKEDEEFLADLEGIEDEFFKEYRLKKLEEMRKAMANLPKFGKLITLTTDNFIEEVDNEKANVTIIVHIYQERVPACEAMNGCLMCLASEYPLVKFCKISASEANMSFKFAQKGVPALLVYKNKELLGNFINLRNVFGDDFYANDVENFLQEYGFLPTADSVCIVRDKTSGEIRGTLPEDKDSDSDFDLD
ncbi:phosducin-like protein [Biomphalaria glabrata]|uniref:Phosducin-like protein n=1 Tax=Biomphalaria glabrata TaxID=6526 RepID=A0A9W3A320_BIOGL|nr:phosducin-like protein [Biomphalaria glabrata]XP_013068824.2 phosducin-like protein [Biomphalaria glabrata]XP_055881652.1 phosducin-like protein [Biomphalaria glabrata]XP_055881653.1 phosducin-like protein [Biomphalaria glabrata]XP_055881654.1 phosducin-like protein [Biomphalaria glabrata]KAI8771713.1 phosducin protein [Biomphalaria glabrata]